MPHSEPGDEVWWWRIKNSVLAKYEKYNTFKKTGQIGSWI